MAKLGWHLRYVGQQGMLRQKFRTQFRSGCGPGVQSDLKGRQKGDPDGKIGPKSRRKVDPEGKISLEDRQKVDPDVKIGLQCRQKHDPDGKIGLKCRRKVDLDAKTGLEDRQRIGLVEVAGRSIWRFLGPGRTKVAKIPKSPETFRTEIAKLDQQNFLRYSVFSVTAT